MKSISTRKSSGGGSYAYRHTLISHHRAAEAEREGERCFASALQSQLGKLDEILSRHQRAIVSNPSGTSLPSPVKVADEVVGLMQATSNKYDRWLQQRQSSRSPSRAEMINTAAGSSSQRSRALPASARRAPKGSQALHPNEIKDDALKKVQHDAVIVPRHHKLTVEGLPTRRGAVGHLMHHDCDTGVSLRCPNFNGAHSRVDAARPIHAVSHQCARSSAETRRSSAESEQRTRDDFITPSSRLAHSSIHIEGAEFFTPIEDPYHHTQSQYHSEATEERRSSSEATATTAAVGSPQTDAQREEAYHLERQLLILASRKAMMEDELRIMQLTMMAVASSAPS
jgi:hypothetical protein